MAKRTHEPGIKLHRTWVNKDMAAAKFFNADYFQEVSTWLSSPIYYVGPTDEPDYTALALQTNNFYTNVLPAL